MCRQSAASAAPEDADVALQEPGRLELAQWVPRAALAAADAGADPDRGRRRCRVRRVRAPGLADDDPRLLPASEGALRAAAPQTSLSSTTGGPAPGNPYADDARDRYDAICYANHARDGYDATPHHQHPLFRLARQGGLDVLPRPHLSRQRAHSRGSAREGTTGRADAREVHAGHLPLVGSSRRRAARTEPAERPDRRFGLRGFAVTAAFSPHSCLATRRCRVQAAHPPSFFPSG